VSIEALVARYGIAAVAIGAGLEGETAVVVGGVLAHEGLVPLAGVMAAAALGSFAADQLFFAAGRRFREHRRVQRVMRRRAFAAALGFLERHPVGFIFAFRFIYGFRTVSPVAIGTSAVPARRFLAVNAVAAVVWAVTFTLVGFVFGRAFQAALGRIAPGRHHVVIGAGVALAVAAIVVGWRWWRRRRR